MDLKEEHIEKKYKALQCFYTQKDSDRWRFFEKQTVYANAIVNGSVIGKSYAECFETNRLVENS